MNLKFLLLAVCFSLAQPLLAQDVQVQDIPADLLREESKIGDQSGSKSAYWVYAEEGIFDESAQTCRIFEEVSVGKDGTTVVVRRVAICNYYGEGWRAMYDIAPIEPEIFDPSKFNNYPKYPEHPNFPEIPGNIDPIQPDYIFPNEFNPNNLNSGP